MTLALSCAPSSAPASAWPWLLTGVMFALIGGVNARIDDLSARVDRIETRMDRIETRLDGFDERLRNVEIAFGKVDQRLLTIERVVLPGPDAGE